MNPGELIKYENILFKKAWDNIMKQVIRVQRFVQKEKFDKDQNCKKFAIFCAKEVKKK